MEVKPGYKQTEVGVIPEEWELSSLARVADVRGGVAKNSNIAISDPISVHYLRVANVQDGFLDLADMGEIKISRQDLKRYSVLPGDVLMNEGGDLDKLGRGAIWDGEFSPCVHQNHVFVVRCKSQLLPQFLNVWTEIKPVRRFFLIAGKQTTNLASISKSSLSELPVALPPLPEQVAIAAALSDVDALLAKLDQLIAKKRDLKQAAMQQLLTGQTRLPGFSGAWEVKRLGEIGEISGAGVDKKISPNEPPVRLLNYLDVYKKDFLRSGDFSHEVTAKPDQVRRCSVQRGDVFFTPTSEVRDDIGHSAIAVEDIPDVVYSYHVVRLRLYESWDVLYRAYAFKNKDFMNQASTQCEGSGTRYVITLPKFRAITVRFPVDVAEQTAIAAVLSDMDADIAALEARRDKTRAIKQGMMQELLTGRIRLV